MKSYLKTKTVPFPGHPEEPDLNLRELSAKAQIELIEAMRRDKSGIHSPALVCKLGVEQWIDETPESIEQSLPAAVLNELVREIEELSGIKRLSPEELKKTADALGIDLSDGSFLDSPAT